MIDHPTMLAEKSCKDLGRFVQLVLAERELLERFRSTDDLAGFAALIVQAGRERGCDFTAEDVLSTVRERHRAWLERGIQDE
jgi:hypothetical protein